MLGISLFLASILTCHNQNDTANLAQHNKSNDLHNLFYLFYFIIFLNKKSKHFPK